MGCVKTVGLNTFPKQGEYVGRKVEVCFFYDISHTIQGEIVRDDMEDPFLTIIKLDDGRHILGTECQYSTR